MEKIKLGVIFGGASTEHDVSVVSGTSVIKNLNKEKYNIYPIYIEKDGEWYKYTRDINSIDTLEIGEKIDEKEKIENIVKYLENLDVIFPVLHGLDGEDGSIQGLFEVIKKPYVGCGILASSIGLDKIYTKAIWEKAGLNQVKYEYVKKNGEFYTYIDKQFNEKKGTLEEIANIIDAKLKYPMFVKPSNFGSSVGITKAKNKNELLNSIEYAGTFDKKIVIEEGKNVREIECAVLGCEDVIASGVGEILPAEEFYSFDAKYKNEDSKVDIPANIPENMKEKIKEMAVKAFKTISGKGLSRVDFFIDKETNEIYINEINTLPGFTKISMYPKLWEYEGVKYTELLDKLINLAMQK